MLIEAQANQSFVGVQYTGRYFLGYLKPERRVCLHPLNIPDHFVDQPFLNSAARLLSEVHPRGSEESTHFWPDFLTGRKHAPLRRRLADHRDAVDEKAMRLKKFSSESHVLTNIGGFGLQLDLIGRHA